MSFSAPFIGINRNRLATDGFGVTTLAAFWGCPLSCYYCLNPQCGSRTSPVHIFTTEELYRHVKKDELYFLATGGGITFGGGEPCLYPDFIHEFRTYCGKQWSITIETCLNVPLKNIKKLYPVVDQYIIDIKDLNNEIYKNYTGKNNSLLISNLKWLTRQGRGENIKIRVPSIPDFNTEKDIQKSIELIDRIGIKDIDIFSYIIK